MEPYEQIRKTEKKYSSAAIMLAVCVAVILIAAGMKPAGKGLILGTLFSIINFVVMGETLPGKIAGTRTRASIYSGMLLLLRYGLLAVPLILAIKLEAINLAATVAGLFMIQIMIVAEQALYASTRRKRKNLDY
ncbi:MAG: ATP synthase subunit I [Desulfosalsimonas sp.]